MYKPHPAFNALIEDYLLTSETDNIKKVKLVTAAFIERARLNDYILEIDAELNEIKRKLNGN